jgi:hypothetical protein
MKTRILAAGAAAALMGQGVLPGAARADVFYSQNFENSGYLPEWTPNQHEDYAPAFSRFIGRYSNDAVSLTRARPAGYGGPSVTGTTILLQFDLYIIDSWDGSEPTYGPDYFRMFVNGNMIFNETFANQHNYQTYREPDIGRFQMGFDQRYVDSIYHMSIPFDFNGPSMEIFFQGVGLQGVNDESWGLDNVRLSVVPVPGPAALAVLGLGIGMTGMRRRR